MKNQKWRFTLGIFCLSLLFILFSGLYSCSNKKASEPFSRTVSFDDGWRFLKDSLTGAENPDFDDSKWRILDVPHDWSIEDLPEQIKDSIVGPFDKSSVDKMSSGYLVGGTGWYRKSFKINETDKDKVAYLQFDGVYMNADVWLNGKHLGFHPYGYTPFYFDVTPFLNPAGQANVVAVRVKNDGLNSRWYSGSGINRHVWLTLVNPVHIDVSGGLYVSTPSVSENSADVKITATLLNSGSETKDVVLQAELFDSSGRSVGTAKMDATASPGQKNDIVQNISVKNPTLWSIDNPNLYEAKVSVLDDDKIIDFSNTSFGIRNIKISAQEGLTINGVPVEMIGGCYHHDNGPLGAASIDRAEERRIEILKQNGFNAIRTSHNPPSPATLDACDRLGMVVINEIFDAWETPKKTKDYNLYFREWWQKDVESWVKRDRNHPSVIIWSIGNEIRETFDTTGLRIARNLTGEIRRLDNTRLVTECFNDFAWMRGLPSRWDSIPEHMALFDLIGYNYAYKRYESDHVKYPNRVMVGTETNPPLALENYEMVKKHPYVIGYFVWTATDNIGEAGVGLPQLRDIEPVNPASTGTVNPPPSNTPGQQVIQSGNL
ncbi:MAG TPA: glycoside hydrolase family 2 TIM barrel-domain containing protein, partial [Draconibacterium sp.]|nr:glycoside hydrolase family 2 TIM barrel-domain containing protein [Draconibacterium sp.]